MKVNPPGSCMTPPLAAALFRTVPLVLAMVLPLALLLLPDTGAR